MYKISIVLFVDKPFFTKADALKLGQEMLDSALLEVPENYDNRFTPVSFVQVQSFEDKGQMNP